MKQTKSVLVSKDYISVSELYMDHATSLYKYLGFFLQNLHMYSVAMEHKLLMKSR